MSNNKYKDEYVVVYKNPYGVIVWRSYSSREAFKEEEEDEMK